MSEKSNSKSQIIVALIGAIALIISAIISIYPDLLKRDHFVQSEQLSNEDSDTYKAKALQYSNNKNYKKAIEYYNKALSMNKDNPYLLARIASNYRRNKEYGRAIEFMNRAIKREPDGANYYLRGLIYYEKGDNELALPDFEKSLLINPDGAYVNASRKVLGYIKNISPKD